MENRFIKVGTLAPFITSLLLPKYIWLDSADMKIIYKIHGRTLQSWRSKGILPFSKILGKAYYNLADIIAMFKKYRRTGTEKR